MRRPPKSVRRCASWLVDFGDVKVEFGCARAYRYAEVVKAAAQGVARRKVVDGLVAVGNGTGGKDSAHREAGADRVAGATPDFVVHGIAAQGVDLKRIHLGCKGNGARFGLILAGREGQNSKGKQAFLHAC